MRVFVMIVVLCMAATVVMGMTGKERILLRFVLSLGRDGGLMCFKGYSARYVLSWIQQLYGACIPTG